MTTAAKPDDTVIDDETELDITSGAQGEDNEVEDDGDDEAPVDEADDGVGSGREELDDNPE